MIARSLGRDRLALLHPLELGDAELAVARAVIADALAATGFIQRGLHHLDRDVLVEDLDGEGHAPGLEVRAVAHHPALLDADRLGVDGVLEDRLVLLVGEADEVRQDFDVALERALVALLATPLDLETGGRGREPAQEVGGRQAELTLVLPVRLVQPVRRLLGLDLGGRVDATGLLDRAIQIGLALGAEAVHQESAAGSFHHNCDAIHGVLLTKLRGIA